MRALDVQNWWQCGGCDKNRKGTERHTYGGAVVSTVVKDDTAVPVAIGAALSNLNKLAFDERQRVFDGEIERFLLLEMNKGVAKQRAC